MDVLSRSLASAAGLLLLLLLAAVVGEYESAEAAPDVASHRIHVLGIYYRVRRVDRDIMEGSGMETRDTGESNVDWLGHHWYIFVVLLVIIIVVCVFVCACVMRRCRQSSSSYVNMQIHQNGSHHNSHISSSSTPAFSGRATQWAPYLSRDNSIHTENAFSSVTQHTEIRHTERSYTEVSKMTREGRSLSVIAPPTSPPPLGASDSPWAVIQSVAKKGTVYEGGKEGRGMSPGLEFNTANCRLHHHSHHHSHHRHHSHSHLHRGHHSHHKHFPKPLAMMNGIPSHVGASLHSFQSTSGSIQSDQSNHSSNQSNQSRSNLSSHSLSDNATVVEVDVHLSPNQLDRAKVVTMAAESAANSAVNLVGEKTHTRSLPHSPHPPSNPHRSHRHSVTGAPITPHSLPPSSPFDHKHLLLNQPLHLPLLNSGNTTNSHPVSPCVHQTITLDRKNMCHHCHIMSLGGCVAEDEGTVVSLDRNSSPSNCQCASLATCEQGQRSPLTLGKKGSTVVSLDQCSSRGSDTLVSLDRAGCSNIGSEHCVRSAYHNSQRTLVSHLEDLVCSHTHGNCAASIHSSNSCTPSVSNFSCSSALHARHDNRNPTQQTVHLNLDSQIEDTPVIKPNFRSHSPRTITREERHILNGSSYGSPLPLQSFSHLHSQTPSSSMAGLPQQLQNIVEQGENECFYSSDNVKFRDRAIAMHCDEHKLHVANSQDLLIRHGSLVKTASDSEEDDENQVDRSATRARDKRRVGKRVREHQSRLKEGTSGSSRVVATPSSGNGDVKVISKCERVTADDENDECQRKVVHGSEASAVSLQDGSPHIHVYESSTSPPQQSSPSSPQCDPLRSAPLDKACSPSRSDSPLSDTDPLGSTASGYAATEESSSTCNVEINSKGDYSTHEFDDIHKALLDVRSQFSYPMQRLLGQVESEGQDENLGLGSNFHPLLSHSHAAQSHSGSDSDQFQTHSVPLNTYGIRVHSMQQIQSVDV